MKNIFSAVKTLKISGTKKKTKRKERKFNKG
jgi:hypothetical protein